MGSFEGIFKGDLRFRRGLNANIFWGVPVFIRSIMDPETPY